VIWFTWVACLWLLYVALARRFHPQLAAGVIVPLAWLAPVWVQWTIFQPNNGSIVGTGIDVKLGVSTAVLVSYLFFKRSTYPFRLVPCDYAMIGMVFVHGLSDVYHQGLQPIILGRMYAEWWAPYVVGRIAFQFRRDISTFWPALAAVAIWLGILSVLETITEYSVYEALFGTRPSEGIVVGHEFKRWGMRRACGPTLNPIYFGCLQLLLLAWTSYAALLAARKQASIAWLAAPIVSGLGIFCSGSRAPILGMLLFIPTLLFFRFPKLRWGMLALALAGGVILISQREMLIESLERWSGEDRVYGADVRMLVNDESKEFSNTRYRLLLFDVYKIAVKRGGLLGFGSEAVTGFPIQVPVGPQEFDTLRKMRSIDNVYLLVTLRFGYLGLICFALAACTAIYQLFAITDPLRTENIGLLTACLGSSLAVILPVIFTVWMPQDYGFILVWSWGASSGMYLAHRSGTFDSPAPMPQSRRLKL
jgi:hypothetical protein